VSTVVGFITLVSLRLGVSNSVFLFFCNFAIFAIFVSYAGGGFATTGVIFPTGVTVGFTCVKAPFGTIVGEFGFAGKLGVVGVFGFMVGATVGAAGGGDTGGVTGGVGLTTGGALGAIGLSPPTGPVPTLGVIGVKPPFGAVARLVVGVSGVRPPEGVMGLVTVPVLLAIGVRVPAGLVGGAGVLVGVVIGFKPPTGPVPVVAGGCVPLIAALACASLCSLIFSL